jgi:hypothetical protein
MCMRKLQLQAQPTPSLQKMIAARLTMSRFARGFFNL